MKQYPDFWEINVSVKKIFHTSRYTEQIIHKSGEVTSASVTSTAIISARRLGDTSIWLRGASTNEQYHTPASYSSSIKATGRHTQMWKHPKTKTPTRTFWKNTLLWNSTK